MNRIKKILMTRDKLSAEAADKLIADAMKAFELSLVLNRPQDLDEICYDWFGLELKCLKDLL